MKDMDGNELVKGSKYHFISGDDRTVSLGLCIFLGPEDQGGVDLAMCVPLAPCRVPARFASKYTPLKCWGFRNPDTTLKLDAPAIVTKPTPTVIDIKCSNLTCGKMNNMGDKKCWYCEGRL